MLEARETGGEPLTRLFLLSILASLMKVLRIYSLSTRVGLFFLA